MLFREPDFCLKFALLIYSISMPDLSEKVHALVFSFLPIKK